METIWLQRPSGDIPWGFRLQGGREYAEPLSVQRVTPGTVAASGLNPGDVILKIGNVNATNITHNEAQEVITGASNILQLTIQKKSESIVPVSPTSSVPQYSEPPRSSNQYQSYDNDDKYQTLPDYRVGSGYQGYGNVNNSGGGYNSPYGNNTSDPYDMRQFEQTPPISGYSTLPAKSGNIQNSESFRPVQQQNQLQKYPFKSTTGIQLQMNPQAQSQPRDTYQQPPYNDNLSSSQSQPMSPVQFVNGDNSYQRQTSGGSNQSATSNGYPQSYYKKPTPFSPTYNSSQNEASTQPRLTRQTSQGSVHDSTVSSYQPGAFLPKSDDAPPPPPPPTNYQPQPEYYRQPSYEQSGRPSFPRQNSQQGGYDSNPNQYGQQQKPQQNNYNQYPSRNQGMYVDTSDPSSRQYDRQGSRPYEPEMNAPNYQRQPSYPQNYGNDPMLQRQTSYGQQQPPSQAPPASQYGGVYTPTPTYNRQPSREQQQQQFARQSSRDQGMPNQFSRQSSRDQHIEPPTYNPTSPAGNTINSFDDILSPFENFQNSNYCDKLFARDNRGDADSGVISDLNSDTPRSNQSSNFSSYSPQHSYPGGYNNRGEVPQQNLLRPAPQAPPPPALTPPPPPPPPPPSNWAPTPQRKPTALQERSDAGEPQMPDKVLNTMLKNAGTQKPFAYVPTGTDLKEFKERARQRRQPRSVMPRGYTGPALDTDDGPSEPQQAQTAKPKPGAMPTPQSGVYKHAQYNSPLKMYSGDAAKEAFNVQSGGNYDVSGVNSNYYPNRPKTPPHFINLPMKTIRTPERRPSDIKESEVYKMCQAADAKGYKPKKPRDPLLRHNSEDDEMRFSGLHTKADIPSKAFKMLNKIAGQENAGPTQEANTREDNDEEPQRIGNYDEASIRYRGNHIPSPSFRLLQTLAKEDERRNNSGSPSVRTNTDDDDDGLPDKLSEEDMVDKRYKGSNIPSKSFKALQMFMDDDKHSQASEGEGDGPKIKVISRAKSPKVPPKPDRGVNSPIPNLPQDAPATEF
ncbi:hypothetical protein ACF0H5_001305 [Mactra antiquata]